MHSHNYSKGLFLSSLIILLACSTLCFTHARINNFYNIKQEVKRNIRNGTQPIPTNSTQPIPSPQPTTSSPKPIPSTPKPIASTPKPLTSPNPNPSNNNSTSSSDYYQQYCVLPWTPYCPNGGCNRYAERMINCPSNGCQTIWLNATVSSTLSAAPCLNIDNGQYLIYCRVDPVSDKLCFRESREKFESCYRKKQLIDYNYYTYANSASATLYYLIMARGTCANQQLETEFERAFYFSYCENIAFNYPIDNANAPSELTIYKVSGTAEERYTIKLGASIKTEVLNDYAVGVRYTGNNICFTNKETKTRYYPLGLSPDYTNKCWDFCMTREQFLSGGAKIIRSTTVSENGQSQESSFQYKGVVSNQPTNPDASGRLNGAEVNCVIITQLMALISVFILAFL